MTETNKTKKVGYHDKWYITALPSIKEIDEIIKNRSMDACPKCHKHLHLGFSGTEIGPLLYLVCIFCGWEKDITDYGSW